MKMLDKIESCGGGYRADILGDVVMDLHVSGILTDKESARAHARIQKKVRAELLAMTPDDLKKFTRAYIEDRKARGESFVVREGRLRSTSVRF